MIHSVESYIKMKTDKNGQPYDQDYGTKNNYNLAPCGFDIETTQYDELAFMYHWQLSLGDDVVLGRTWDELQTLYQFIVKAFRPSEKHKLLILVHNFSFEWQFIKKRFKWLEKKNGDSSVFALSERKVCYAITEDYVEFRDTYILTNMSLKKLAATYCKTQKLEGGKDLDYSKLRNSKTTLSESEKLYCINDVVILKEFAEYCFKRWDGNTPLTKTSIVRGDIKTSFKAQPKEYRDEYKKRIWRAFPSESQYCGWMEYLYAGGWTHTDFVHTGETIEDDDMAGIDFKSSYPSSCFEPMPVRFVEIDATEEVLRRWYAERDTRALIIDVTFYDLRITGTHSTISKHKVIPDEHKQQFFLDNGRIRACTKAHMLLNEYDFETLQLFYKWKKMEIHHLYISYKEMLPKFILDVIYDYYNKKETLPKDSIDYFNAKQDLNSIYGMMVTSLYQTNLTLNENAEFIPSKDQQEFWKAARSQIMLPVWGIWVSSRSRRNLLVNVAKFQEDAVYGDTDSIKLLNYSKHLPVIEEYNRGIMERNKRIQEKYGYNLRQLGCFDYEGHYKKFKTLGAKRYIYTDSKDQLHATIAGLPKHSFIDYCDKNGLDPFETFDNNFALEVDDADKLAAIYEDKEYSAEITDEEGNTETMSELSGICLVPTTFTLTMTADYLEYIKEVIAKRKYTFGIRGL